MWGLWAITTGFFNQKNGELKMTNTLEFSIQSTSFRLTGTKLETLYKLQWLEVWKITIVQNNKDLAIDFDKQDGKVTITTRDKPRLNGIDRMILDEDIVMFELENGKTIILPMVDEVKKMLTLLRLRGVNPYNIGADVDVTRIP